MLENFFNRRTLRRHSLKLLIGQYMSWLAYPFPTPKYALKVSEEIKYLGYSINTVNTKLAKPS